MAIELIQPNTSTIEFSGLPIRIDTLEEMRTFLQGLTRTIEAQNRRIIGLEDKVASLSRRIGSHTDIPHPVFHKGTIPSLNKLTTASRSLLPKEHEEHPPVSDR